MTISDVSNVKTYTGNGVTTAYSTVFSFYASTDIVVKVNGSVTTAYTVTGGNGAVGTVTFNTAPANSAAIVIQRLVAYEQQSDFVNYDGNPADVTEKQFDLLAMQCQQLRDVAERSITVPVGTSGFTSEVTVAGNGGKFLRLNSGETGFDYASVLATEVTVTAFGEDLINSSNAADAVSLLGLDSVLPLTKQSSTPSTPTSGVSKLYFKTDGQLYALDDAGDEFRVGSCNRIYAALHGTPESWELPCNGSTVAKTSGATYNGTKYKRAFFYLWNKVADTEAPVVTGRGASAQADWDANKRITVPDMRDYVIVGISVAGSITTVAAKAGASTVSSTGSIAINPVTLSEANLFPHSHKIVSDANSGDTLTAGEENNYLASHGVYGGAPPDAYYLAGINTPAPTFCPTSSAGSGSSFTPTGTFTGSASSVLQKSFGAYFYLEI